MQVNCERSTFTRASHVIGSTAVLSRLHVARGASPEPRSHTHRLLSAHQSLWFEPRIHHTIHKEDAAN